MDNVIHPADGQCVLQRVTLPHIGSHSNQFDHGGNCPPQSCLHHVFISPYIIGSSVRVDVANGGVMRCLCRSHNINIPMLVQERIY